MFVWPTDFWHAADSVYLTAYLLGAMLLGTWLGPVQAWPWVLAVVLVIEWWWRRVSGLLPVVSD